ncbi:hypothetical protein PF005_g21076 [Phytophthora fragariae]|uniref:Peptidase A2 domain-containing protein n=2 Tax=Phytophthora fragariae TaxID=53985 RepID=A0A6A3WIS8_9STRA|nr:hypothetical protein PF005_g21076 [Phytophthora fragariae]
MWNRDEEASTVRYEDELTTMETTTNWERLATVGYATTTEGSQPSERATGVLANEEVAYDLENDEIVNAEPSERASGVLTTEEVAFDLEKPYLRTEEQSERAIGALTTEEVAHDLEDDYLRMEKPSESATDGLTTEFDEETTRKTTANVCNGTRCRCLEALPVEVKYVKYLPSKKAEGDASVVPLEKKTDTEESDPPATKTGVPPEYDRNAGPSVLEQVGVASEDGHEDVELTKESGETPDESAASTDTAPPPEEPPPPHARLFTEEELRALEARTPSTMGVELEEYDKELEERLFPLDEVELEKRKTLAVSAEAKRANRDFRADPPPTKDEARGEPEPGGPTELVNAKDDDASINEVVASLVPSSRFAATTVDESRVIANTGVPRVNLERKDEDVPSALPFQLSTLVRSVVFLLILDEEAKNGERCPTCHYPKAYPPEAEPRGHFVPGPFSTELTTRAHELIIERAGTLRDSVLQAVLREISRAYLESDGSAKNEKRRPGLMEVKDRLTPEGSPNADVEYPVPEGKHVICSVEGFEATSVGFIDGLPVELLIDTGAIASLVDSRASEARPGEGPTATVPWQFERQKLRTFAVADHLHVHALLGTDALNAFRAVIDMEESVITLMETDETIQLGTPRVEEMYVSRINSTVRLCPGGQPLVVANLMGKAPDTPREAMPGLKEAY